MLRVGVIGCGKIAQIRHLPEYAGNPNVEIGGLYDVNRERARELSKTYGATVYESYRQMLAQTDIDAVSVCSSNDSHAEIALAALDAGKHVLCEKPMATTLLDCENMATAARERGRYLMIGQNQRLAAAHQKARELIRAGVIGKVLTFRTTFGHGGPETWTIDPGNNIWFFDRKRAAMGAMADLGIHKTDLIQYLLGQVVVETTAFLGALDKKNADGTAIGVDDNAMCIYRMDGGAVGTMTASWTYYAAEDNSTVVYGTKGELRLYDDPAHSLVLCREGEEPIHFDLDQIQTNDNQTKSGVIDAFVHGIETGDYSAMSGESVLTAMRAVFASIQASDTGRTVQVNR